VARADRGTLHLEIQFQNQCSAVAEDSVGRLEDIPRSEEIEVPAIVSHAAPELFGARAIDVLSRRFLGRTEMATATQETSRRETASLIGSDKVEGTAVYRSNGEKVGQIERVMIDKLSGKVAYAVMSFGGFMGIGEDYYPLPWAVLTYNPRLEGYEVNVTEQQIKGAPHYSKHENWDWSDPARSRSVYDYYGAAPY
jgi:PRC-barrel domain protein